mmetsp:Transcript_12779/g.36116  ORF Transcript_12779/g.36116 Transcript_12779/m.36116 type:complete len:284 (+) Transcript_12779:1202-2053(+)
MQAGISTRASSASSSSSSESEGGCTTGSCSSNLRPKNRGSSSFSPAASSRAEEALAHFSRSMDMSASWKTLHRRGICTGPMRRTSQCLYTRWSLGNPACASKSRRSFPGTNIPDADLRGVVTICRSQRPLMVCSTLVPLGSRPPLGRMACTNPRTVEKLRNSTVASSSDCWHMTSSRPRKSQLGLSLRGSLKRIDGSFTWYSSLWRSSCTTAPPSRRSSTPELFTTILPCGRAHGRRATVTVARSSPCRSTEATCARVSKVQTSCTKTRRRPPSAGPRSRRLR